MASLASRLLTEGDESQAKELRGMRPVFQYSLFAAGAVLTMGVLSQTALDNWAVLFARPYNRCLDVIIDEFHTFVGSTYVIIILLGFAPAFLFWRKRSLALVSTSPPEAAKDLAGE